MLDILWIDNVEDDLIKMGIKRWRSRTDDRKELGRGQSSTGTVVPQSKYVRKLDILVQ